MKAYSRCPGGVTYGYNHHSSRCNLAYYKPEKGGEKMSYTPTQWNTVEDKEKFVAKFKGFVKAGFKQEHFTKEFYNRMSMMRGHIAHYDRGGFYQAQFGNAIQKAEFLDQWTTGHINGDPAWTWSDVEQVLMDWLKENPQYEQRERAEFNAAVEAKERTELARLTAKYTTA
jgi:hypothetical protein